MTEERKRHGNVTEERKRRRPVRLDGRNGEIWQRYIRGETQSAIAERYGISQQRVSQIIREVADSIPQQTREEVVTRELDLLWRLRTEILDEIYDAPGIPVTAGRDGTLVVDPETGQVVRDYSGRIAAAQMSIRISETIRRMLGIDAAQRVDVNVGEQAATEAGAAEARAFLARHGDGDTEEDDR